MMFYKCLFATLLMMFSALTSLHATNSAEQGDYRISFITCHAGEASYELYGHTALRVVNAKNGVDWAYNYGIFDFDSPGFTWRFVLGETDYMLAGAPFNRFLRLYASQGRRVDEQLLNLTNEEARNLAEALEINARPENRVYRYNFFQDNCVTRALDMVEANIQGKLVMPPPHSGKTFRSMVNEHTAISPWDQFGQNLLLGQNADTLIGLRGQCFSPLYTERFLADAVIIDTLGNSRPLVKQTNTLVQGTPIDSVSSSVPTIVLFILFFGSWLITRKGKIRLFHVLDNSLLVISGLGGLLLFILCGFSSHPAVGQNWSLLIFNPLSLVFIPLQWWWKRKGMKNYAAYIQLACILVYVLVTQVLQIQEALPAMWMIVATLAIVNLRKLTSPKK